MDKKQILKEINKEPINYMYRELKIMTILAIIIIMLVSEGRASDISTIDAYSDKVADFYKIPRPILKAVIYIESSYRIDAVSHKGAYGLMQVTKPAYDDYLRCNPNTYITNFAIAQDNWRANIAVGSWYLKIMCFNPTKSWKSAISGYFWGVNHSSPTLVYYNKIKKRVEINNG
jgi:hypothetical protein